MFLTAAVGEEEGEIGEDVADLVEGGEEDGGDWENTCSAATVIGEASGGSSAKI